MKFTLTTLLFVILAVSIYALDNNRNSKKSARKSKSGRGLKSYRKSIQCSDSLSLSTFEPSFEQVSATCTAELESIVYSPPHEMKEYLSQILTTVLNILQPLLDPLNNPIALSALKQIALNYNISITLQTAIPTDSTTIYPDQSIQTTGIVYGRVVDPTYLNEYGFVRVSGNTYQISGIVNNSNGYLLVVITMPSLVPTPDPEPTVVGSN